MTLDGPTARNELCSRGALRVLVDGASRECVPESWHGPNDEPVFSRVIESDLLAAGYFPNVHNVSKPGKLIRQSIRRWQRDVLTFSPHVVVLDHGMYECIHRLAPHWFERYANSLTYVRSPFQKVYRKAIVRPLWRVLVRTQHRVDTWLLKRGRVGVRKLRRAERELRDLIDRVDSVGSPLILVLGSCRPTGAGVDWFPGMGARVDAWNEMVEAICAEPGVAHNIRFIPVQELALREDLMVDGTASPDGFHFSGKLHAEVGHVLTQQIQAHREAHRAR